MIWFDLDNSPHVPLFRPVFKELGNKGINFTITCRDFAQTKELLEFWKIPYSQIGEHGGSNKLNKILKTIDRSIKLSKHIRNKNVKLSVSQTSRSQAITSWYKNIPSILMLDYEYTETYIFNIFSQNILIPSYIPDSRLRDAKINLKKVIRYNGFKEEIYLKDFLPDSGFRGSLGISDEIILVIIRPPSLVGNYHDPKSEILFSKCIEYFKDRDKVLCLIVNRTKSEESFIKSMKLGNNVQFLNKPVDGLQLLYTADITISGGGTMNRESALLGTETYSIFTGRRPYLDEYLQDQKRLKFVESVDDISNIKIEKKNKSSIKVNKNVTEEIVGLITDIYKKL